MVVRAPCSAACIGPLQVAMRHGGPGCLRCGPDPRVRCEPPAPSACTSYTSSAANASALCLWCARLRQLRHPWSSSCTLGCSVRPCCTASIWTTAGPRRLRITSSVSPHRLSSSSDEEFPLDSSCTTRSVTKHFFLCSSGRSNRLSLRCRDRRERARR